MTQEKLQCNRDFKGIWIPREIWLADGLTATEKVLWAEIHSLYDRERGGCYATNEYLANFMGAKERTVRDALCKFRQLKLIEDVSFNGRERVIKALEPDKHFSRRLAEWRKSATLTGENPPPRTAEIRQAPIYTYSKDEGIEENTPPIPPQKSENEAKASEKEKKSSSKEFSEEVKQLWEAMLSSLIVAKPNYLWRKNLLPQILEALDFMIRLDKRSSQEILDVFRWALSDDFWKTHLFKPNPAKYLREKFDQLEMKMQSRPVSKVDRRTRNKDGTPVKTVEDLF